MNRALAALLAAQLLLAGAGVGAVYLGDEMDEPLQPGGPVGALAAFGSASSSDFVVQVGTGATGVADVEDLGPFNEELLCPPPEDVAENRAIVRGSVRLTGLTRDQVKANLHLIKGALLQNLDVRLEVTAYDISVEAIQMENPVDVTGKSPHVGTATFAPMCRIKYRVLCNLAFAPEVVKDIDAAVRNGGLEVSLLESNLKVTAQTEQEFSFQPGGLPEQVEG